MDWKTRPKPYLENKSWYKKRNAQIYKDRHAGITWRVLIGKYDLSETYLRKVYKRIKLEQEE